MLLTFDNLLTRQEVAAVHSQLAGAPWASGLSAGPQALAVKHNLQLPEDFGGLMDLRRTVMRALNRSEMLLSAALPYKVVPPNFNRYTTEHSHYGWHTDSTLRYLPDGSVLRTDISATLFLCDPASYEGGELCIQNAQGDQCVKLAAGSLVIYPSGAIHQVTPITRGERVACYFFMQSVVKDTECRRQLHEMDLALIDLRQRCGETDPALVRLTGLYNNLLRRWSEC
ncbi:MULTISPECIES: Fe2+-dependent dioxygenase [unclassified Polaromonas]|uniref:Fe2+-dependent dioxygenase n=1 Tax=unclassified Polaromonas TaxID=2638319 RepID=UPI0018CAA708|nr:MULTISPECIES: Fe2+-dependent dioxygenase [unclassified Polaromonas]MBG6070754.1 PKHD-type hydroxylase [Polaromonas sp. CG_9.7]MBG6112937.1 PKHD-type hydroxylase [Polaromonas sp. CG_9.2]MDH6186411.1 PKHD-type hydroxylase [Polaromonas sp. CG_23.6]